MNFRKGMFLIIIALLLTACSPSKGKSNEGDVEKKGNEVQLKVVDNFEIQFQKAQKLSSEEGEVLQLNFAVKNKSADTRVFDSFVFVAENKEGKKLEIAPKENFGSELKPGETQEGSVYYYLEGAAPITVTYDDLDSDETETWGIKEIEE